MSDTWHKPIYLPLRGRKPRMLFIGNCTQTPAVWYLEPFRQFFDVYHVGIGSRDFDISNIPTQIKINTNELGRTSIRERVFSIKSLFDIIGTNFDVIFHVQDYTYFTDNEKSPIPYIFLCTEAVYPRAPRCAWVVLAQVEMIKNLVRKDWMNCPNLMYSPYAIPVESPVKFPDFKREFEVSFTGELYSLPIYQDRREVVKFIHEKCMELKIPSQFHYLFPADFSVFTEFTFDKIQRGYTIHITPDLPLFLPEESGPILSVDKTKLGVMDEVLLILLKNQQAQIKFKSKTTDKKLELIDQKIAEIEKHKQGSARQPESGKGVLGPTKYTDLLQSSKIALNVPTPAGCNFRDIEACLSGAMLLTLHTTDMDLLGFEDEVNCRYYSSKEEALEIIQKGFDPEIAMRGWDLVVHGREFWKHARGHIGNVRFKQEEKSMIVRIRKNLPDFKGEPIMNALKSTNAITDFKIEGNDYVLTLPSEQQIQMVMQSFGLENWSVGGLTLGQRLYDFMQIIKQFANIPLSPNAKSVIPI